MLSETERLDSGVWLVTLAGDLDLSSIAGLEHALSSFDHEQAADVMLDLDSVPFIDSTAMGVMIRTSRRLREHGGSLSIARPQGHPARVFERIGVDRLLPVFETLTDALAAISEYRGERSTRERAIASHLAAEQLSRAAADLQSLHAREALETGDTEAADAARARATRARERADRARAEAERQRAALEDR